MFKVTILGSSGALPAFGRFPSSQFVNLQNRFFLIDCGEGTQMQLMAQGLPYHKIDHIFISHLHGDHYLGLMGLLFSLHLQRRTADLHLYSLPGLDEIITLQLRYSNSALNYKLVFHRLPHGTREIIFEDDALTVETIPLLHKLPCNGFLIREKQKPLRIDKEKLQEGMLLQYIAQLKQGFDVYDDNGRLLHHHADFTLPPKPSFSYAYCSDTAYFPALAGQVQGVNLLYHEATFMEEEQDKALETRHSTAREAARIAAAAGAEKLIIGHFSARYRDLAGLLAEAREVFANTELAIEGTTFTLEE
ncbi:MAG: ribonuclease Z [Cyclobacteriaceae bacterium]|jgi:ribonuclease Z